MVSNSSVYKLQNKVTKLRSCCSYSQNRIFTLLEKNNYDMNCQKELKKYADMCVTLEALSTYVSKSCCHGKISKNCSNELKNHCGEMKNQCNKLKKYLNTKDYKYSNCAKMYSCC